MEREHISTAFDIELNELKQSILVMGGKVELMIANSVKSLVDRDTPLAERTIALDHEVNAAEVSIDERCLELLALRQPAARDLRFITIALKIVTDLERMGDQCANIAKRTRELNRRPAAQTLHRHPPHGPLGRGHGQGGAGRLCAGAMLTWQSRSARMTVSWMTLTSRSSGNF